MADDETTLRPTAPVEPNERARPYLELLFGDRLGERVALRGGITVVGKGEHADLQLAVSGVSRAHARLDVDPQWRVTVTDLGSTNGTFVGGQPIDSVRLQPGDRIQLGPDVRLRLLMLEQGAPTRGPTLSSRQLQLARLVASGLSNVEIARQLEISPRTVTSHLDHIYTRLDIRSRTALTRWVLDRGLA